MGDQTMWISMAFLAFGLAVGYFVGYRNGSVAGELAALKHKLHRSDHDVYRRRLKRTGDESQLPSSGSPSPDRPIS